MFLRVHLCSERFAMAPVANPKTFGIDVKKSGEAPVDPTKPFMFGTQSFELRRRLTAV